MRSAAIVSVAGAVVCNQNPDLCRRAWNCCGCARPWDLRKSSRGQGPPPISRPLSCPTAGGADSRLIYLRGDVVASDLKQMLAGTDINVTPRHGLPVGLQPKPLPRDVIKVLQSGGIDAVTLMSPRTAETWAGLVAALSPPVQLSRITYLCLSERVAEALGSLKKTGKVLVASHPNLEEMLALVKRLAANSKAE